MVSSQSLLFSPYRIRDVTLPNRIVLAPMMQCKAINGFASDWHFAHFSKFALGGFGTVMTEAVAVEPIGRITYGDLGLWSDEFVPQLRRITDFIHEQGALAAIQLAHAGRKACWQRPWDGNGPLTSDDAARGEPPWGLVGPSEISVGEKYQTPHVLSEIEIQQIIKKFGQAAARADAAGFDIIEIHGAHGYLIASFLTPLVNNRQDKYGRDRAGRMRFALEVVAEVRANWPEGKPLFFRVSSEDGGGEGGWGLDDSVVLALELHKAGVDIVDCSSGGLRVSATLSNQARGPGYQVPFADRIKHEGGIPTMAVGLILDGPQAEKILREDRADLIAIGRQAMFDPFWAHHAAQQLGADTQFEKWDPSAGWWLDKRVGGLAQVGYDSSGLRKVAS
jgi:2,4-dienoyl-CoA reductase-like NADH-dependent reductase (Old Yellow Enzyme family)